MKACAAASSSPVARFVLLVGCFCLFLAVQHVQFAVVRADNNGSVGSTTRKRGINRHIKIVNESGGRVQVHWVHPSTRDLSLMSDPDVAAGAEFPLESYVSHEFQIRQLPDRKTGACAGSSGAEDGAEDQVCKTANFQVSDNDEQVATITSDFRLVFVDNKIKAEREASDLIQDCHRAAKDKIQAASSSDAAAAAIDELLGCVEGGVASALERVNEEIAFQASVRREIAATLENYTCVDDALNSTADITASTWVHTPVDTVGHQSEHTAYSVHIKHERPASKIHLIENFITQDECTAMEEQAASTLHRATVADVRSLFCLFVVALGWPKLGNGDRAAVRKGWIYYIFFAKNPC
jgi:hypothetical protein